MTTRPETDRREWTAVFPPRPASVGLARLYVRRRLTLWRWEGDIEDAVLVASELLANAVRYGRLPARTVLLRLALDDDALLIDVSDPVPAFPNFVATPPAPHADAGRGLAIVRTLATDLTWFLRDPTGKTVRATLRPGGVAGAARRNL
ncbi:ATP-binding protein [Streptomyces sp. NPDC060194]|uniref:ATP-binding protein n=1 Tax=Streptomyces sp. NPDC060194 TaxID=3347069 RepID=UPI00366592BA